MERNMELDCTSRHRATGNFIAFKKSKISGAIPQGC